MSDDIPVGSPPVPPGRHAAPGGWYADPARDGQERYWDGWNWTRNVRGAEGATGAQYAQPYDPEQPWLRPPGERSQPESGHAGGSGSWPSVPTGGSSGQGPDFTAPGPTGQHAAGQEQQAPGGAAAGSTPEQYAGVPAGYIAVPTTNDGVPLASWGARLGATLIDGIVINIITLLLATVTGVGSALSKMMNEYLAYAREIATTGAQPDPQRINAIVMSPGLYGFMAVAFLSFVIYHAVLVGLRGATLGKMALGLRVVPAGCGRAPKPGWGAAIARPIVWQLFGIVPYISFVLVVLDVLFPLWDRNRQTLHDKAVSTQVIRTR